MKITYHDEEKTLLKTSNTLIIPAIVGLYRQYYTPMMFNIISWAVSSCFWSLPHTGMRRNIDLYYQPIFATYMYSLGMYKSDKPLHKFIGNIFFMNGLYLFYCSSKEYKKINRLWFVYHSYFHLSMATACSIVYLAI